MDNNKNCIQEHYGHRRQPALGKAMPVTALLLNLNLNDGTGRRNHVQPEQRDHHDDDDDDKPPRYFNVTDEPPTPDGEEPPPPPAHYGQDRQLAGCSELAKPCLNCLGLAPAADQQLNSASSAINEMCLRLCGAECRQPQGLSLGGHQHQSLESQRVRQDFLKQYEIAEALAKTSAMTSTVQMRQRLAARKLEIDFEMDVELDATKQAQQQQPQQPQQQQQQGVASASPNFNRRQTAAAVGGDTVPPPSSSSSSFTVDYEPPRDLLLYLVSKGNMAKLNTSRRHSHSLFIFSIILRKILYRKPDALMGSFNSAPKINNVDSQDDGLELPKGLSTSALLQHVQQSRGVGIEQPSLLSRCFLKPLSMGEDVTDGLRCLQLNTVSRVCSAPIEGDSLQNIRLLQWNILSQTLGQHNDGFVRCPEEALDWQHRKYLIVQEILQNQPDVICLQEVDHFKFLQTVLGSQNYAGIFFPKPDSPCLYIEQNNGPDGCAIFYKRDKLQLLGYDTRVLEVWRVQSNQVAIAARLQLKASGREFCVCTTHLKARHGALLAKLRNEQGRDLMRFVKQFAGETPLLLCGDFNAEPVEPIYATILGCDLFKLGSAYADVKLDREQILQPSADVNEFVAQSMKREPPYTTWKIREEGEECHTIDYVFYTPDQLKIKNCLEFPAGEEIGKNRTPSYQYPSDHFSLVCDFELLDGPPPAPPLTSDSGDQCHKTSDDSDGERETEASKHGNIQ